MQQPRTLFVLAAALATVATLHAQNTLKDGTALLWDKEITVGADSLRNDSVMLPALSVPVYEASASDVNNLLKKALPGADFKKQGGVQKAASASIPSVSATPVDVLAAVSGNRKENKSTLLLTFLDPGTFTIVQSTTQETAVRDLAVKLNKAVVQGQIDFWKKKLEKADSKTASANKDQDKAQAKLKKTQAKLAKSAKEKSKLQNEHAILQKQIDLDNQKWTLSQDPKDLKRLTKSRSKITKNEAKMAKAMQGEAGAQKDLSKNNSDLPEAQKAKEEKAAAQAEVQRTVDALQRKLENIR